MIQAISVTLFIAVTIAPFKTQDGTEDATAIEASIDDMLSSMQGKFSVQTHAERLASYGAAAVPILIRRHGDVAEDKRWAFVACLCGIPTRDSRSFLMKVIARHTDRRSTDYAIRHYPIAHDAEIIQSLVTLLSVQDHRFAATERLRRAIFRRPATASHLVNALVDDTSSQERNREIHAILAHVSGYAYSWPNRTADGKSTPNSENSFWRNWWGRNQERAVFDWLIEALYRTGGGRRPHALQVLGTLNDTRAITHFVSALDDDEYSVRYWAVVGLKKAEGTYPAGGYRSETFEEQEDRVITQLKRRFSSEPTLAVVHGVFKSWLNRVIDNAKNGRLPQPETGPPMAGDVFVDGFGWVRPEILEYCLTLTAVELQRDGATVRLILTGSKRPREFTGRWDGRWDTNRWVAEMVQEDGKWRISAVRALVAKPNAGASEPESEPKPPVGR